MKVALFLYIKTHGPGVHHFDTGWWSGFSGREMVLAAARNQIPLVHPLANNVTTIQGPRNRIN
jgi:hypothetical protein